MVMIDMSPKALVWDSCLVHNAIIMKDHMKERNVKPAVIPGGLTAYVQAGDIGIYKFFRTR